MKRVIRNILIYLFLFLSFNHTQANSKLKNKFDLLNQNDVFKFLQVLESVCKTKKFFHNIKNHRSYKKFGDVKVWKKKCDYLQNIKTYKNPKDYLKENFKLSLLSKTEGLLTGYYQPVINVSRTKDNKFKYPILKKNKIYNKKARSFIEANYNLEDVLIWTDDKVDLFFLHIQGSGIGEFPDMKQIKISYDGNNSLNYSSIGKYLIKKNYIRPNNVNLFTIKSWLSKNSQISNKIMNVNNRFIFFKEESIKNSSMPIGAFGQPLISNFTIAIDKNIYPIGLPFLFEKLEDSSFHPVVSLDTGSAIIGYNRADLFFGRGKDAEEKAGLLKKKIYLYALVPYTK